MSHTKFRVTSNVRGRRATVPARTITLRSVRDDQSTGDDILVVAVPEAEGVHYRKDAEYFCELWPVPEREQVMPQYRVHLERRIAGSPTIETQTTTVVVEAESEIDARNAAASLDARIKWPPIGKYSGVTYPIATRAERIKPHHRNLKEKAHVRT